MFRYHHETTFPSTLPPVSEFSSPHTCCAGAQGRCFHQSRSQRCRLLRHWHRSRHQELVVKYIKQGKAFIVHTDNPNIFFAYSSLLLRTSHAIRVPTKGDRDKKRNKQPLENDARTTSRSIVALSSARKHCTRSLFLKLISFLEDSEKMENRSQIDSNCQWLILFSTYLHALDLFTTS